MSNLSHTCRLLISHDWISTPKICPLIFSYLQILKISLVVSCGCYFCQQYIFFNQKTTFQIKIVRLKLKYTLQWHIPVGWIILKQSRVVPRAFVLLLVKTDHAAASTIRGKPACLSFITAHQRQTLGNSKEEPFFSNNNNGPQNLEQTTSWCCGTHTFVTPSQNTLESQTHLQGLHLSPLFTFLCFQTLFFFFLTLLFLSLNFPPSVPSLFPSLRFQPLLLAHPLSIPL